MVFFFSSRWAIFVHSSGFPTVTVNIFFSQTTVVRSDLPKFSIHTNRFCVSRYKFYRSFVSTSSWRPRARKYGWRKDYNKVFFFSSHSTNAVHEFTIRRRVDDRPDVGWRLLWRVSALWMLSVIILFFIILVILFQGETPDQQRAE